MTFSDFLIIYISMAITSELIKNKRVNSGLVSIFSVEFHPKYIPTRKLSNYRKILNGFLLFGPFIYGFDYPLATRIRSRIHSWDLERHAWEISPVKPFRIPPTYTVQLVALDWLYTSSKFKGFAKI